MIRKYLAKRAERRMIEDLKTANYAAQVRMDREWGMI